MKIILQGYNSIVLCCKETYTRQDRTVKFRNFQSYHIHSQNINGRASGKVTVMIKNQIPQTIHLNNLKQAVVTLLLHKYLTLCSIYTPPSYTLGETELDNLIIQLPTPFILLGSMNAHNTI